MKFDVVVGNPPYYKYTTTTLSTGENNAEIQTFFDGNGC